MRINRIDDSDALYEAHGWQPADMLDQPVIDLDTELDRLIDRVEQSAADQRLAALRAQRKLCREYERAERNRNR